MLVLSMPALLAFHVLLGLGFPRKKARIRSYTARLHRRFDSELLLAALYVTPGQGLGPEVNMCRTP
jgi:hypothetical protein